MRCGKYLIFSSGAVKFMEPNYHLWPDREKDWLKNMQRVAFVSISFCPVHTVSLFPYLLPSNLFLPLSISLSLHSSLPNFLSPISPPFVHLVPFKPFSHFSCSISPQFSFIMLYGSTGCSYKMGHFPIALFTCIFPYDNRINLQIYDKKGHLCVCFLVFLSLFTCNILHSSFFLYTEEEKNMAIIFDLSPEQNSFRKQFDSHTMIATIWHLRAEEEKTIRWMHHAFYLFQPNGITFPATNSISSRH